MSEIDLWKYNIRDCVATFEIDAVQLQRAVKRHPKQQSVIDFQNSLFHPLMRMTMRGMKVDLKIRAEMIEETEKEITDKQKWIEDVIGHGINIDSPLQMKKLFFSDFGQREVKIRKGAQWVVSCGKEAMPKIAEREPLLKPLIDSIEDIRSCRKDMEKLNAKLTDEDRICCSYNITGTKTYRFAHTETAFGLGTNLGNVNSRIKAMIVPDPGMTMFDIDLDSADLSIVAWESNCAELKEMLRQRIKVYVEAAKEYYKDSSITKDHWAYRLFKSLCHGTNYLGAASGLASRCGLQVSEVERIQKWYFGRFPEIKKWHEKIIDRINHGFVENIFGHRCYFLGRISDSTYREGVAWIPQCVPVDHEVLTIDGWKKIIDTDKIEEIAVWNERGEIFFERPKQWNLGTAQELVEMEELGYKCTSNHRIPYYNAGSDKLHVQIAGNLPKSARVPRTGMYSKGIKNFTAAEICFIAAIQADGHYDKYRKSVIFEFRKERKIKRLIDTLNILGIPYSKNVVRREATVIYVPFGGEDYGKYKTFGSWLLEWSPESLDFLLEEISFWDGYIDKNDVIWFFSSKKENCEWIATIAALRGKRARWMSTDNRGKNPNYRITIAPNKGKNSVCPTRRYINGNFPVACPTVSTGFFLIRHEGEISVTGNSTVARIINTGLVRIDALEQGVNFPVYLLNQVHDSLVGQYPTDMAEVLEPRILECCSVELPYAGDPLTIRAEMHTSDVSWAKCK